MQSDLKQMWGRLRQGQTTKRGVGFALRAMLLSLLFISACLTQSSSTSAQGECQEVNDIRTFDYRSYGIGVHRNCGSCDWYNPVCLAELGLCETLKVKQIALGKPVEAWILLSREAALSAGVSPIPPEIRAKLAHLYSPALMDKVRFKIGSGFLGSLQWLRDEMGNKGAITLVDVIVFSGPSQANDLKIWAHELEHVHQYEQLGTDGFAQAYVDQTCILPGDTFLGGYDSGNCQLERRAERNANYSNQSGFVACCTLHNAPATLVLHDRVLNGQEDFVALDSITIGPKVVLGSNGNISLRAGRVITFSPEFRSDTGGKLFAKIDPSLSQNCSR